MNLLPQPRSCLPGSGVLARARAAIEPSFQTGVTGLRPEGYRLSITPEGIAIQAADPAGAFYAHATLDQIRRLHPDGDLPCVEIEDAPDFLVRGVMLDISRDKVPTMATLRHLISDLAALKINHLELYTEHTFAYRNHREVWEHADPMTAEEIRELDAYCRERFIELVPNQNSFGHMERWLKRPRYAPLAEAPNGFTFPWGAPSGPFSLNPLDPRSLDLIEELYAELLPNFTSGKFNVGCDETFDLGLGRSAEECAQRGNGRVYLEFLLKIRKLVHRHGRRMHFWGDIIHHHPELIPELPGDAVALEWGYEADHPFAKNCAKFREAGVPFYVCPGTSSWNTLGGRTKNCLENLHAAAEHGLAQGAIGYLNTDWGDNGHWQYLPVSYLGFAAGAALSWCLEANRGRDWPAALDAHVFRDSAGVMGRLACDLGNVYLRPGVLIPNDSALFHFLRAGSDNGIFGKVTAKNIEATLEEIEAVTAPLARAQLQRPDAGLISAEFANTAALMCHACHRAQAILHGGVKSHGPELARELAPILAEHRRLWLARNREGGLSDSVKLLERRLEEYGV
jgi:hexosaminidase